MESSLSRDDVFTFALTIRARSAPCNPSNGLSGWRGDRSDLQRASSANRIWSRLRNDHDALLRFRAAGRHLYALVCLCLFRSVRLWMARRNLALRRRRTRLGIRSVMAMERSTRDRLGGCRSRRRRRPRGAVREANVVDATETRRRSAISCVIKAGERVIDPNVLHKASPIDDSLAPAGVIDRERDDVCSRRPPVCKREHDRFISRYVGAVPDDATLVDIYGSRRSRRRCRGGLQQQSATSCQHEPGDASPITPTSSHGVTRIEYAVARAGGSLRTDDPLGCSPAPEFYHIIANRCPG
jgi:hypothetical protein